MMILAIETSTPVCSVSLQVGGGRVWEKRAEGRGVHSEKTFLFARELMERAGVTIPDLDAVLYSNGPGSYTGLRIGTAAIKGMLFGRDVALHTFPTLLSFAAGLPLDSTYKTIYSVIDARRQHLYVQKISWNGEKLSPEGEPKVEELTTIEKSLEKGDILVGTGWDRLDIPDEKNVDTYGLQAVSANNLIKAWNRKDLKLHFIESDPRTFEPEYLNMAQVNNSSI